MQVGIIVIKKAKIIIIPYTVPYTAAPVVQSPEKEGFKGKDLRNIDVKEKFSFFPQTK